MILTRLLPQASRWALHRPPSSPSTWPHVPLAMNKHKKYASVSHASATYVISLVFTCSLLHRFSSSSDLVPSQSGRISCIVHNAGLSMRGLAAQMPLSAERHILDVNAVGPMALTKALLRLGTSCNQSFTLHATIYSIILCFTHISLILLVLHRPPCRRRAHRPRVLRAGSHPDPPSRSLRRV
jgi:hypothetical protein